MDSVSVARQVAASLNKNPANENPPLTPSYPPATLQLSARAGGRSRIPGSRTAGCPGRSATVQVRYPSRSLCTCLFSLHRHHHLHHRQQVAPAAASRHCRPGRFSSIHPLKLLLVGVSSWTSSAAVKSHKPCYSSLISGWTLSSAHGAALLGGAAGAGGRGLSADHLRHEVSQILVCVNVVTEH